MNYIKWAIISTFVLLSEQVCLFNGRVEDSSYLYFFRIINGTGHGSPSSLTTLSIDLVSVLDARVEPWVEPETSESAADHGLGTESILNT